MRILLTGGSGCGKSTFAEQLAMSRQKPWYYVESMRPYGDNDRQSIGRHQSACRKKGFEILTCYTGTNKLKLPSGGTVLYECLCNITANEIFDAEGAGRGQAKAAVLSGLDTLAGQCSDLIVVTNEVGSDGEYYSTETQEYVRCLGQINRETAKKSDVVVEMVCGIPIFQKGNLHGWGGAVGNSSNDNQEDSGMILVIGALGAGKRTYVQSLGFTREQMTDARLDANPVIYNVQNMVDKIKTDYLYQELRKKAVVIINETGCGVIPIGEAQREWRRNTGKLSIQLAAVAKCVIRVAAGIPVVLK